MRFLSVMLRLRPYAGLRYTELSLLVMEHSYGNFLAEGTRSQKG